MSCISISGGRSQAHSPSSLRKRKPTKTNFSKTKQNSPFYQTTSPLPSPLEVSNIQISSFSSHKRITMNRIPTSSLPRAAVFLTRGGAITTRSSLAHHHPHPHLLNSAITTTPNSRTYTTSAPKEAESPSAESGGSRSKDAAEAETASAEKSPTGGVVPDALAEGDARGRTGGGKPLNSSQSAPARPKIYNASVHGGTANLTKEQQEEVDKHNREFESKHGRAPQATGDKVDKSFWSGKGGRTSNS